MSISIECEKCGKTYNVRPELGGKTLKCRGCGGPMPVPSPGGTIYRHAERTKPFEPTLGDGENIEAISNHIEEHVGPVAQVLHEIVSDLVHLDVHQVVPTKSRPYHTLITSGMSERPMTLPDEVDAEWQFAEMMLCLPEDWPLEHASLSDENNYWPLRWLKMLARLPHEYDTWLGWGHTIPNSDPPEPFSDSTKLCGWMVIDPQLAPEEFGRLTIDDRAINFYAIVPLYCQEIDYKLSHGAEKLMERLQKNDVTELIDPNRRNVCKKLLW